MKKRTIGAVIGTMSLLAAIPAGSQAETVDTTCQEGKEPVVFVHVSVKPAGISEDRCLGEQGT